MLVESCEQHVTTSVEVSTAVIFQIVVFWCVMSWLWMWRPSACPQCW